jgi:hypothetical protein
VLYRPYKALVVSSQSSSVSCLQAMNPSLKRTSSVETAVLECAEISRSYRGVGKAINELIASHFTNIHRSWASFIDLMHDAAVIVELVRTWRPSTSFHAVSSNENTRKIRTIR